MNIGSNASGNRVGNFVGGSLSSMGGGVNQLNSPYEAAKRLQRESISLMTTSQRFIDYLNSME